MKNKTKYILSAILFILSLILFGTSVVLTSYNFKFLWLVIVSTVLFITFFITTCLFYFKNTEFICPHCNSQFKPKTFNAIMAIHTPTKRLLTCPICNKTGWCKDKFIENENTLENKKTINN